MSLLLSLGELAGSIGGAFLELQTPEVQAKAALALGTARFARGALAAPDADSLAVLRSDFDYLATRVQELDRHVALLGQHLHEAQELLADTVDHMRRTGYREKRRWMVNVLVNGLSTEEIDAARRRYFVRVISELSVDHIAMIRTFTDLPNKSDLRLDDVQLTVVGDLHQRGLLAHNTPKEGLFHEKMGSRTAAGRATDLARDLLAYISDPRFDDDEPGAVTSIPR